MRRPDWNERLAAEEARGLRRSLPPTDVAGTVLDYASNDYLALRRDPRTIEAARIALERDGVGSGASRLLGGNTRAHEDLETTIARLKGTDAALVFSSGFAANLGLLSAIADEGDCILCDRLDHASLVDGARLARAELRFYRHGDVDHLRRQLERSRSSGHVFVATDGVFSMDGVLAPLPDLVETARAFDATVIVDDAHATGVIGPAGAGTLRHFEIDPTGVIQMGTLSKALGAQGGFVAGDRALIAWLVQRARSFVYSTGLAPALAAAARRAIEIVDQDPGMLERRQRIFDRLRNGLIAQGWTVRGASPAPMMAVIVGGADAAVAMARSLEAEGIRAPAIRPPTVPGGTSRLRLAPTAAHTDDDVDCTLAVFAELRGQSSCRPIA